MPVPTIGFAHRGARSVAPDNTLQSFRLALQLGASGLETDAWLTRDGVVVLDHDGSVGPPWRRRPIAELPRASLPPHIPALTELYRVCGADFELSVDLKAPTGVDAVVDAASEVGAAKRLWLCHPDENVLVGVRRRHRDVRLVHSTSLRRLADAAQRTGAGDPRNPAGLVAATAAADHRAGLDAINLRADQWTQPLVDAVHDASLMAFGWDAQRRPTLERLLAAGIDGLYSDHVPRMMQAIARTAR